MSNRFTAKLRRMLSMLLVLAMVLSMVGPVTASATAYTAGYSDSMQLQVGERIQLKAPLWYFKTTWSSSDETVATVSQMGILTGVKAGEAVITAKSGKLLGFIGLERTTTYHVTVTEVPEKVELHVGDTTQLTVEDNGGKVLWSSSNPRVAKVSSNGTVTAMREGEATVTAKIMERSAWNWLRWYQTLEVKFQIIVTPVPTEPEVPTEPTEPEVPTEPPVITYTVTFESNGGSSVEAQIVEEGMTVAEPTSPVLESAFFLGWYLSADETDWENTYDFKTPIESDITLYALWLTPTDTDNDGLMDDVENNIGTDPSLTDTDNDGISDYDEVIYFGSDPLNPDDNEDGVIDGQSDHDEDDLIYLLEIEYGTSPINADTDGDSLMDGEEINTYHTDPLNADTDGDGASDLIEITIGTDPTTFQERFSIEVSPDVADEDQVIPSLQLDAEGALVDSIMITPVEDDVFFDSDFPGYLGMAYDFTVDGEFENAIIQFEFDPVILENGADPAIFYFNETDQTLEELETTIDGNVASAVVTHFSTYILIDRNVYYDSFTWEDVWDTEGTFHSVEIVLVIDDSGSMSSNDGSNQRLTVAQNLIDKLPEDSKIGIVWFASSTNILTPELITDREAAKAYLTTAYFQSYGGTYMYNAINSAFSLFQSTEEDVLKMMVVLSDGSTSDSSKHAATITAAVENNVRIYTVGLGSSTSYFTNYLKPLAEGTGGAFYLASNADGLASIYDDINKKIDLEADADQDGIPDYYEDNMIAFNGKKIVMDKNSKDTDGDGLEDGDEVIVELVYNADHTQVYVKGKVHSYPDRVDSDGDGYDDYSDLNDLVPYRTPVIVIHGLHSNTSCFGVKTNIKDGMNDNYGKNVTEANSEGITYTYTDVVGQKITSISKGRLGYYLENSLGYKRNKTLYAFNYPNQDMVQYNGSKLKDYLTSLIADAQKGSDSLVADAQYLFATQEDMDNGSTEFILVGHSMGGLVSRYLVENIGTEYVQKIITIDTPHYGSGLADTSDALANVIMFSPAVMDLEVDSTLFGNKEKTWNVSFRFGGKKEQTQYALDNQSPMLVGNNYVGSTYYAIGGYDVGRGLIGGELSQLADDLHDKVFSFEFTRAVSSKDSYKSSINDALSAYSVDKCGEDSKLDLGNTDGDNTVDHMSQFAVRFDGDKTDYVILKRTALVVNAKDNCWMANAFHNVIHQEADMFAWVKEFIND